LLQRQLLFNGIVRLQRSMLQSRTVQLPYRRLYKPAPTVPGQLRILQRKLLRHNTVLLRQRKPRSGRKATGDVIDQLYNELDSRSREYHKSGSGREPHTRRSKRISRANRRLTYHQLLQDNLVVRGETRRCRSTTARTERDVTRSTARQLHRLHSARHRSRW